MLRLRGRPHPQHTLPARAPYPPGVPREGFGPPAELPYFLSENPASCEPARRLCAENRTMTLRARLVAGLVVLMTVGLAIFGVTMYELYSRSQYNQLTSELQSSVPPVTRELSRAAGVYLPNPGQGAQPGNHGAGTTGYAPGSTPGGAVEGGPPPGAPSGGGQVLVTPGTYGELVNKSGKILSYVPSSPQPRFSAAVLATSTRAQLVHVGSLSGGTEWLASIGPRLSNGDRVIVALPTTQVTSSLHHLIVIEVAGAVGVLLVLSAGSGLM